MTMETSTSSTLKRIGRPVHPLWAHFHRGEKRNRYHYHAFCSYCVARHGIDQVSPIRGVSADMLRHLENCPNCSCKVVDTVKELLGQRERTANAKKNVNGNNGTRNRLENEKNKDQVLLLDAMVTADDAATGADDTALTRKRTLSESLDIHVDNVNGQDAEERLRLKSAQHARHYSTRPTKRGPSTTVEENFVTRWKTSLLQTVVVSGISLWTLQKSEFQELLHALSPIEMESNEVIRNVGSPSFLEETAKKLAHEQLDRVKEGMLNSTIKSGLTLSVTCWRTLDLQYLVAFTLVNSNGDAACVRVEDLGAQCSSTSDDNGNVSPLLRLAQELPLAHAIEDVLLDLNEKNICVVGIVADSVVALSAARKVCLKARWHSLLVVPCMSALLTFLAGSILTHKVYCDAVGQLIELAAYFSNSRLQASLRAISGENDARLPLPTRNHCFSFVLCLTKALHYSDAITALCSTQDDGNSIPMPLALRELVLGNNQQLWKTLRGLAVLLAPLREAYSLVFQAKPKLDETNGIYDHDDECATTVHGGLTLAHIMYQLGRMSQQYAALAESTDLNSSSSNSGEGTTVVAHRLHELLDTVWQRYDLPTMVLAFVFDFHIDTAWLDSSNSALQWKAVSSYFQHYFQRWFCQSQEDQQGRTASGLPPLTPIASNKVETILNAYQLRQFPFDADTTNDYADVSSFYSFVSDSHPEICALCCRVYAVALACADVRRVIRGIGFVPSIAQTTEHPKQVELLLHVGFASSLKTKRHTGISGGILPELMQASRPEELLCSHEEWKVFSTDWRQLLELEMTVDELEQDKKDAAMTLSLDQLFFEALPPLPAAVVVAPSPHDPSGAITL